MNINTFTHALVAGKHEALVLESMLVSALRYAEQNGLVATIERKSIPPLAQGNHEPSVFISATKDLGMKLEALAREAEKLGVSAAQAAEGELKTIGQHIAEGFKKFV